MGRVAMGLGLVLAIGLGGCTEPRDHVDGLDLGDAAAESIDAALPSVDAPAIMLVPVRGLPGLQSIDFYERSGGTTPTKYTFTVNGPELTTHLADPLTASNKDIAGITTEYYDVYYSDADGTFNLDGAYLTISGVFGQALPSGGGLNLAEMVLNTATTPEYGTMVGSYVAHGNNSIETDVSKCIDSDMQTQTTMGNTMGTSERLRITLGFPSTVIIE